MSLYLIRLFIQYKYVAILPIATFEGPIITVVAGVLLSRGYLTLVPTFLVVLLGDVISDSVYYWMGWHGRNNLKKIKFVKVSEKSLLELEGRFRDKPKRTIFIAKFSYGLGAVFMAAAGVSQMQFGKFLLYSALSTAVKSSLLLALGYYFGKALGHFAEYLQYYTVLVLILVPAGFYLAWRIRRYRSGVAMKNEIKSESDL